MVSVERKGAELRLGWGWKGAAKGNQGLQKGFSPEIFLVWESAQPRVCCIVNRTFLLVLWLNIRKEVQTP